uniref:Uncharacterized protein n=1 Tax=Pararge aegeria TaxID=116150 RepID=S4PC33_9NEOP
MFGTRIHFSSKASTVDALLALSLFFSSISSEAFSISELLFATFTSGESVLIELIRSRFPSVACPSLWVIFIFLLFEFPILCPEYA